MFLSKFLPWTRKPAARPTNPARRPALFRPSLEALEDRQMLNAAPVLVQDTGGPAVQHLPDGATTYQITGTIAAGTLGDSDPNSANPQPHKFDLKVVRGSVITVQVKEAGTMSTCDPIIVDTVPPAPSVGGSGSWWSADADVGSWHGLLKLDPLDSDGTCSFTIHPYAASTNFNDHYVATITVSKPYVPPVQPADIRFDSAKASGNTVRFDLDLTGSVPSASFNLWLSRNPYHSSTDTLLWGHNYSLKGLSGHVFANLSIEPNGIRLPGVTGADASGNYYIVATVNDSHSVQESNYANNSAVLTGYYFGAKGTLYVQGDAAGGQNFAVNSTAPTMKAGSYSFSMPGASVIEKAADVGNVVIHAHGRGNALDVNAGTGFTRFVGVEFWGGDYVTNTIRVSSKSSHVTADLEPDTGLVNGPGFGVGYTDCGKANVTAAGGTANLTSRIGGTFDAYPNRADLLGAGGAYAIYVGGFSAINASFVGGEGSAFLHGSTGRDVLKASPDYAQLSGPGFSLDAKGFSQATVYTYGQGGSATIYDGPGNNELYVQDKLLFLHEGGKVVYVNGFSHVTADAYWGSADEAIYRTAMEDPIYYDLILQGHCSKKHQ